MKIYIWKNKRTDSDVTVENNMHADHSAALVISAKDKEEAMKLAKKNYDIIEEPVEFDMSDSRIIIYADGDC